ncbi:MAG: hypothetical protein ACI3VR_08535 [Intestinibacter sp.]|uniref:hypothetical protein n=1 Tax=Intestinibacter sp. TaxID=1965304 RepID=UPI003F14D28E
MKNKKLLVIVLIAILVPAIGFGFNYFKWSKDRSLSNHQTLTVDGDMEVTEITADKKLVPGDNICDAIELNIKSTAPSLLRVKVETFCNGTSADIGIAEGLKENWVYGGDKYYYYTNTVDESTGLLQFVDGIKFMIQDSDLNDYQGKEISTKITAEMVQAKYGVFETEWSLNSGHPAYSQLKAASDAVTQ